MGEHTAIVRNDEGELLANGCFFFKDVKPNEAVDIGLIPCLGAQRQDSIGLGRNSQ